MRIFFILSFLLISAAAFAADEPDVGAVENYLNGITTLKSNFIQTAPDGSRLTGVFMLKRPGKLRFEYDAPVKDFIVADGTFVYYYDSKMKQQSSMPVSRSLADFFLRKTLKLSGDIHISDVRHERGLLRLTLVQAKDSSAGSLTLFLTENPMQLKKWQVIDAQGLVTEIELSKPETGVYFDSELFHYYDPEDKKAIINR